MILGPGSLFTSIIPNLLIDDIGEALKNTEAEIIYVTNIMTQKGETTGFDADDHIKEIEKYLGHYLDAVIINTATPEEDVLESYTLRGDVVVQPNIKQRSKETFQVVYHDFKMVDGLAQHDPKDLSQVLMEYIGK